MKYHVTAQDTGKRFDQVLTTLSGVMSRSVAQRMIKSEGALVNGQKQTTSTKLREGDVITYEVPEPEELNAEPEEGELDIIFEDDTLIIVNKPAGLVVHPAPGHPSGTLVNFLRYHFQQLAPSEETFRPGLVHRIDKDTSGLLVVAKTEKAHDALSLQFQEHSIHRRYHTVIWGSPLRSKGTIDSPIARHRQHRQKMAIVEGGKDAVTHWRVVKRFGVLSHMTCELETGRTHQIRVHLSSNKMPLVGDPQYGKTPMKALNRLPEPLKTMLNNFPRQALHAAELGFKHPTTQEFLKFEAPLPDDMQALIQALEDADLPSPR